MSFLQTFAFCHLAQLFRLLIPLQCYLSTFAANPPPLPTQLTTLTNHTGNITLLNPVRTTLHRLPPFDPWNHPVDRSTLVLRISHFTPPRPLPVEDALICFFETTLFINEALITHGDELVGAGKTTELSCGRVRFYLWANRYTKWADWGNSVRGVAGWMEEWMWVGCEFLMIETSAGGGTVGNGAFVS